MILVIIINNPLKENKQYGATFPSQGRIGVERSCGRVTWLKFKSCQINKWKNWANTPQYNCQEERSKNDLTTDLISSWH
jgi:hypothetical protein